MTTDRFRVTYPDPISLWRASVVEAARPLDAFQPVLTHAVGLNQDHHWCFGTGHNDWDSAIQDKRPGAIEQSSGRLMRGGEEDDTGETTMMLRRKTLTATPISATPAPILAASNSAH